MFVHVHYDGCVESGYGEATLTLKATPWGHANIGSAARGYFFQGNARFTGQVQVTVKYKQKAIYASANGVIAYGAKYSY